MMIYFRSQSQSVRGSLCSAHLRRTKWPHTLLPYIGEMFFQFSVCEDCTGGCFSDGSDNLFSQSSLGMVLSSRVLKLEAIIMAMTVASMCRVVTCLNMHCIPMSEYVWIRTCICQELCKELSEINLLFNPPPCLMRRQLLLSSIVCGKPRPGELHCKPRKPYHVRISLHGLTSHLWS